MSKKQLIIIAITLALSGCATGFMTSYTYDPNSKKSTKTVYSPLFSSESTPLAEGAEFRPSVVITRRVEPVSYSLLNSIGGLGPDDLNSTATVVVHFKNDSQQVYKVDLKKIIVQNQTFVVNLPEIILNSGDRFDTESFVVKVPTYNTSFELDLFYELDGNLVSKKFTMVRQTMEGLKKHSENK